MRTIKKKGEPEFLLKYRKGASDDLDSEDKDQLRRALVKEQRGLCCYCMGRISADRREMKIEHWHSRANYSTEQFSYRNLLASCLGGEGKPKASQHCDSYKGSDDLKWNPADSRRDIEKWIRYDVTGNILSSNKELNCQLESVLNLNVVELQNRRIGSLEAVLEWWRQKKGGTQGRVRRATLEKIRANLTTGTGVLDPYCQVSVWWLEQRIKNLKA